MDLPIGVIGIDGAENKEVREREQELPRGNRILDATRMQRMNENISITDVRC